MVYIAAQLPNTIYNACRLMNKNIKTNIVYNELEYFSYLNHWLLFLFFFILLFYCVLRIMTFCFGKIYYNNWLIEFFSCLFLLIFLIFIISPSLLILLDIDYITLPSIILYNLGFQWAWTYSISYLHINIGYQTYQDHYIISSLYYTAAQLPNGIAAQLPNNIAAQLPVNNAAQLPHNSSAAATCHPIIDLSMAYSYLVEINNYLIIPLWSLIKIYCLSLDVIHSLGFSSFGFKIDVIPGRINLITSLRLNNQGLSKGFCYELCGEQHSSMVNIWINI